MIICELPLKNRGSLPLREVPKYIALGCSALATDFLMEVLGLAQFPRTKSPKDNIIIEVKFFIALYPKNWVQLKTNLWKIYFIYF